MTLCGCAKSPSEDMMKKDIEKNFNAWTISYVPEDLINVHRVTDEHTLAVNSISVEKSLTEKSQYTAWVKVDMGDAEIKGTMYVQLQYQKYDRGKWELEYCNEYQQRYATYTGGTNGINLEKIKEMFDNPIQIENISLIKGEMSGQGDIAAKLELTGINHEGYYSKNFSESIEADVEFRVLVGLGYNANSQQWRLDSLKTVNSKTLTPIDGNIINNNVSASLKNELSYLGKKDSSKYLGVADYSILPRNDNLAGQLIENGDYSQYDSHAYNQISNEYEFTNAAAYYIEKGIFFASVGFNDNNFGTDIPPLCYVISNSIYTLNGSWSISGDYIYGFIPQFGNMTKSNIHIEYPYGGDENKAYVKSSAFDDSSGRHFIDGIYDVKFDSLQLVVKDVRLSALIKNDGIYGHGKDYWLGDPDSPTKRKANFNFYRSKTENTLSPVP